jgi:hypothetical protein
MAFLSFSQILMHMREVCVKKDEGLIPFHVMLREKKYIIYICCSSSSWFKFSEIHHLGVSQICKPLQHDIIWRTSMYVA